MPFLLRGSSLSLALEFLICYSVTGARQGEPAMDENDIESGMDPKRRSEDIRFYRSNPPSNPDKNAIVRIGVIKNAVMRQRMKLWANFDQSTGTFLVYFAVSWIAAVAAAWVFMGSSLWRDFCAFLDKAIDGAFGQSVLAAALTLATAVLGPLLLILSFHEGFRWLRRQAISNMFKPHSNAAKVREPIKLTFNRINDNHENVTKIVKQYLGDRRTKKIESIKTDSGAPYRIIKGLAPVDIDFFRSPKDHMERDLTDEEFQKYKQVVRISDWMAAGVLGIAGARPALRHADKADNQLAYDRFWRSDMQELHDRELFDVFLRFHQSTVELNFPPANAQSDVSTFKTYTVINNFRRTPFYMICVSDVVKCLLGVDPDIDQREQDAIYRGLAIGALDRADAVQLLTDTVYAKLTARGDRYKFPDYNEQPEGQAILWKDETRDDYLMAFDPARVWPRREGAERKHAEAVMALRNAIHLVARRKVIQSA